MVVVGAGTHREIGGAVPAGATEVRAPSGVVSYAPADMTVTVLAGTPVSELDAALAEHDQECPLDPVDPAATVGGVLAAGLSGHRRLRHGPVRDRVLEVRFVTGDGRLVRGGGPTVKNVTGYDLPRLLVGSLGTLGVLVQVTLRTLPRPECSSWTVSDAPPAELAARLFRPSCLAWDGTQTHVLLEGHPDDVASEEAHAGLVVAPAAAALPALPHRGRASVRPGALPAVATRLREISCRWLAEGGVGTVHVSAETEAGLADAANRGRSRGRLDAARGGRARSRSVRRRVAERRRLRADQGRVRSDGQAQPRPAAVRPERGVTLHLDEDELVACVACGLCLPACPTYRVTGLEIASPRGRIAAMQAVQLHGAPIDAEFTAAMDACLVCRGCEVACPSSVPFGHLMEGARAADPSRAGRAPGARSSGSATAWCFRAMGSCSR